MHVEAAGRSDVGRIRSHNEDRYAIQRGLPAGAVLCLLADGMGGHAAGDVAATLAVEAALAAFGEGADIAGAVARANAAVHARSADADKRGMGTTLTCALVRPDAVQFAHIGDCRLYLLRDGALRQLSRDHSWVAEEVAAGRMTAEEARTSGRRNLVTRALGFNAAITADEGAHALAPGDTLLLCSDGVHGAVPEEELARTCALPVEGAAAKIIDLANTHSGADNATAVVARILGDRSERAPVTRPLPNLDRPPAPAASGGAARRRWAQVPDCGAAGGLCARRGAPCACLERRATGILVVPHRAGPTFGGVGVRGAGATGMSGFDGVETSKVAGRGAVIASLNRRQTP